MRARQLLITGLQTLAVLGAIASLAGSPALPLAIRQPIERADAALRQQGWQADGDPALDSFDRELSGNDLTSLRHCSGTGAGFCRYDYRRGPQRLEVITVPGRDGDGLVHGWRVLAAEGGGP